MRRAGKSEAKPRGSRRYSRTPLTTYYRTDRDPSVRSPFQKRPARKNPRKYILGATDILLVLLLFFVLIYSLALNSSPKVSATSSAYHSNQYYEQMIKPAFNGLANRNKVTFNEAAVIKRIEAQFPEVRNVSIELPFLSEQPKVSLLISPPAFRLNSQGQIFVIDTQGIAVDLAGRQPKYAQLLSVSDQSGFQSSLGKPALSSPAAGFIDTIIRQSQQAKVPITSLTLPAVPFELDLRTADQPYYVKFYTAGDAGVEAGQFLAARQKFAQSHLTPSQYLDVRIQGKVFYK